MPSVFPPLLTTQVVPSPETLSPSMGSVHWPTPGSSRETDPLLPLLFHRPPLPSQGLLLPPGPFQPPLSNTCSSPLGFCPAALNKAHLGWPPPHPSVCPPTCFQLCKKLGAFCCLHGLNIISHLCVAHLCFPYISFLLFFCHLYFHSPSEIGTCTSCGCPGISHTVRRGRGCPLAGTAGSSRFRLVPAWDSAQPLSLTRSTSGEEGLRTDKMAPGSEV